MDTQEDHIQQTIEETKRHRIYSWFSCNPVYALKCKYYFLDKDGFDTGKRKGHPLACGEDTNEDLFFEIGKQYLFTRPDRHFLLYKEPKNVLEYEYYFEKA